MASYDPPERRGHRLQRSLPGSELPSNADLLEALSTHAAAASETTAFRLYRSLLGSLVILGTRRRPLLWRLGQPIRLETVTIRLTHDRDAHAVFTDDEAYHQWVGPGSHDHQVVRLADYCEAALEEVATDIVINPGSPGAYLLDSWVRSWLAAGLIPGAMIPMEQSPEMDQIVRLIRDFLVQAGVDQAGLAWAIDADGARVPTLLVGRGGAWKQADRHDFWCAYGDYVSRRIEDRRFGLVMLIDDLAIGHEAVVRVV